MEDTTTHDAAARRRERLRADPTVAPHGRLSTYMHYGCRCGPCTRAATTTILSDRDVRRARIIEDPSLAPHGDVGTYNNWGCRCDLCKAANTADVRERRRQRRAAAK